MNNAIKTTFLLALLGELSRGELHRVAVSVRSRGELSDAPRRPYGVKPGAPGR